MRLDAACFQFQHRCEENRVNKFRSYRVSINLNVDGIDLLHFWGAQIRSMALVGSHCNGLSDKKFGS